MIKGIAINCACYKGYDLEKALKSISEAGYRYVEMAGMRGWCEYVSPGMPEEELRRVQERLKTYGLSATALAAHVDYLADEEAFDWLKKSIPLAKQLGASVVTTSPGEGESELRIARLKELDAICAEYDVTLALEPHGTLCTGKLLRETIEAAGTKRIGINYDTANVLFFGGVDPLEDLPEAIPALGYVHFKDKRGGKGVWDFPAAGEGELPLAELAKKLEGFDGFASAEIEFTPAGAPSFEEIVRSAAASLAYLEKLI